MYIYVCVYKCTCDYKYTHVHICMWSSIYTHTHMYTQALLSVSECIYIFRKQKDNAKFYRAKWNIKNAGGCFPTWDGTQVSCMQVDFFTVWTKWEPRPRLRVKIITILDFYISAKTITCKNNKANKMLMKTYFTEVNNCSTGFERLCQNNVFFSLE